MLALMGDNLPRAWASVYNGGMSFSPPRSTLPFILARFDILETKMLVTVSARSRR